MIKSDRGTVLFVRLYKKGSEEPIVINVVDKNLGGIVVDGMNLEHAFDNRAILGSSKRFTPSSVAGIQSTGIVDDLSPDIGSVEQLDKIELTIVYPNGFAKISERSGDRLRGSLVWDDNLIKKVKSLNPDTYWTGDWTNNPAILAFVNGQVVEEMCRLMPGC
ncbi:hypothetical protein WD376_004274 [Vibrio vulnificus]|nr:hypothetical protein [Vibrio vulnificus]